MGRNPRTRHRECLEFGCGAWIRTKDLRVMSPTSCRCSTPRFEVYRRLLVALGRRGGGGRRARGGRHEVQLLARLCESAEPCLLLVGRPRLERLHVLLVAGVLGCDLSVLLSEVGDLLAQAMADVTFLSERDTTPDQPDADREDDDGLPHAEWVRAHAARDCQSFAVSHAATFVKDGGGADYIKWLPGLLPQLARGLIVEVREGLSIPSQLPLRGREPFAKPLPRDAQRVFRVDLERARQRHDREQQVPHLLEGAVAVTRGRGQLARLFRHRLRGRRGRGEIEADAGRAFLEAERPGQGGEGRGHAVDDRLIAAGAARLLHLLVLPVAQDLVRARDRRVAEDVRMPLYHLRRHRLRDLLRVEPAFTGSDLGVHRDLEEQVAELLHHLGVVGGVDRLQQLIGLLEQVGPQRLMGLLPVPRTSARRSQPVHDLEDRLDSVGERLVGHGRDITAAPRPDSYSENISSRRVSRSACQPSPFLRILIRFGPTVIRPAIRRESSSTSRNLCGSTRMAMSWPSAMTPRRPMRCPRSFTLSE